MTNAILPIKFYPVSQSPTPDVQGSTFLLYNRCDGYHLAEHASFDDGVFYGFYSWGFQNYFDTDFYVAWAVLPNWWEMENALGPWSQSKEIA